MNRRPAKAGHYDAGSVLMYVVSAFRRTSPDVRFEPDYERW
jgi:hypothetical protein